MKTRKEFNVVFMGTPDFAVPSLELLYHSGYSVPAVVTAPDKPAGRGLKMHSSAVKKWASQQNIHVLQPPNLKDEGFRNSLGSLLPDLFVVVAFRMLPESIWKLPVHGAINLHASLLPQYRGAAPINHAVIHGETTTGLTTFFINQAIDTGNILFQQALPIGYDETAGELHDRLMIAGSELVLKTVDAIREGRAVSIEQSAFLKQGAELRTAPRIYRDDCRLNWSRETKDIYNQIRGLSPWPAAFTTIFSPEGNAYELKIYRSQPSEKKMSGRAGEIVVQNNQQMYIVTGNGAIELLKIKLAGKSEISVKEFLKGFRIGAGWKAE